MPSYGHPFSTSSPILTIQTHAALENPLGNSPHHNLDSSMSGQEGPWPPPALIRPQTNRKRSRDDAAVNLNDDEPLAPTSIEPIQESEEDWIYGEGMVLIKPGSGYVADASSQSGTWVEEQAAEEEARRTWEAAAKFEVQRQQERPTLRSNKSLRLEQGTLVGLGPDSLANSPACLSSLPDKSTTTKAASDSLRQPVIDDFTLHLGIGWRRISDEDHIQAAARGWARYIENHYPLSTVLILLESKGLQSYLVESSEGYFLFAEDLRQGRLVSKTAHGALTNLRTSPPSFEGSEILMATESPRPIETPLKARDAHQNDLEMDMS